MIMGTGSTRSDRVKAYKEAEHTRTTSEREREILRHLPLVHTVVDRICAHLPASVDREDLFHAGVIGLIDALSRFDASRDNAFSTYAVMRIRGQVIDELRARDWVPRGARERARGYQQAVAELGHRLGRLPSDHELAVHLGVGDHELVEIEREAQLAVQVSLDAPLGEEHSFGSALSRADDEGANPARHLERDDRARLIAGVLDTLSEQERLVVKLYYFENLLMKEIAEVLGVTESRICQIHSRIMAVLRTRLGSDELLA
jgi:RNA polymerase sigma factor for flagellar operon FliA